MPRIFHLHIENFRGIERFDHIFNDGLTCIIGRGDSGKTTILDAISYALTPQHTIPFHDGDFYNCNIEQPIVIEVTLIGLTEDILRKFGDRIRGVKDNKIISSMSNPEAQADGVEDAVTIRLKVEKDLETVWEVLGDDGVEPRIVRASERELFNCFYISEYNDRHFTLSKGTPLSSLFRQKAEKKSDIFNAELIAQLGRDAKQGFESAIGMQDVFNDVIKDIIKNASEIGISTGEVKASIDQREFLLKDNKIALHHDNVPLRQLGKGSKRLLSLAIQLSLTDPSGIILIDEIEQGLEPDRVQQVLYYLRNKKDIQVLLTTHSIHAVQNLRCKNIVLKRYGNSEFCTIPEYMQGSIIKHPGALLSKKIIIAEGATEWGFLLGLNEYRQQHSSPSFSFQGVSLIDGNGDECFNTAMDLCKLGYQIVLWCDSEKENLKAKKLALKEKGVMILDCEEGLVFEQQIFKDCNWDITKTLINLRIQTSGQSDISVYNQIKQRIPSLPQYEVTWKENDNEALRKGLGIDADKSKWFKSKEISKIAAKIILENAGIEGRLKFNIDNLSKWIDTI